jgi:hypothetical protein
LSVSYRRGVSHNAPRKKKSMVSVGDLQDCHPHCLQRPSTASGSDEAGPPGEVTAWFATRQVFNARF